MSSRPLLTGEQEYVDDIDTSVAALRLANSRLEAQNRKLDEALRLERNKNAQFESSLREIRRLTLPWLRWLKAVHGELDAMEVGEGSSAAPGSNQKWESWKQRMPGRPAEFIDLLLIHESMSVKQLMAAAHCAKQTVYDTASKMIRAGIIANNGGRYSLKES